MKPASVLLRPDTLFGRSDRLVSIEYFEAPGSLRNFVLDTKSR